MKFARIMLMTALLGPLLGLATEACCLPLAEEHAEAQMGTGESTVHLEAREGDCCHTDHCAECTVCHLQAFSPVIEQTLTPLSTTRHYLIGFSLFTEVASTVLTPPPTL